MTADIRAAAQREAEARWPESVIEQNDEVLRRRGGRQAFEHDPDTPTWLPGLTMAEVALMWEEHERKKKEETND